MSNWLGERAEYFGYERKTQVVSNSTIVTEPQKKYNLKLHKHWTQYIYSESIFAAISTISMFSIVFGKISFIVLLINIMRFILNLSRALWRNSRATRVVVESDQVVVLKNRNLQYQAVYHLVAFALLFIIPAIVLLILLASSNEIMSGILYAIVIVSFIFEVVGPTLIYIADSYFVFYEYTPIVIRVAS